MKWLIDVQDIESFVASFIESAPYVVRMRGSHWVFWIDQRLDQKRLADLAEEIAILRVLGAQLSLILGGNPEDRSQPITPEMQMRIDTENAQAMRHWMNLLSRGWVGIPDRKFRLAAVSGNIVTGRRIGRVEGIDYGYLGAVRTVDKERITELLRDNNVIVSTGSVPGVTGLPLVVPPLELAVRYAELTKASKLVLVTKLPKQLITPDEWTPAELDAHIAVTSKREFQTVLKAAAEGVKAGIGRVTVVDGRKRGSVLTELLTPNGSGILIANLPTAETGPVAPDEISELVALISRFEPEGNLAPRSREIIEAAIDDFRVLKVDGRVVACGAVRTIQDGKSVLIESVAVHHDFQGQGLGTDLVQELHRVAADRGASAAYVLTTGAEEWFKGFGYQVVDPAHAPKDVLSVLRPERNSVLLKRTITPEERWPD